MTPHDIDAGHVETPSPTPNANHTNASQHRWLGTGWTGSSGAHWSWKGPALLQDRGQVEPHTSLLSLGPHGVRTQEHRGAAQGSSELASAPAWPWPRNTQELINALSENLGVSCNTSDPTPCPRERLGGTGIAQYEGRETSWTQIGRSWSLVPKPP